MRPALAALVVARTCGGDLRAASRAAARMDPADPLGHGMVLRLRSPLGDDALRFYWLAAPAARLRWPGVRITGVVHSQDYLGYAHRIGGASLPPLNVPPRSCFVLSFDRGGGGATEAPAPSAVMLRRTSREMVSGG